MKIEAVVVCDRYADFLAETLPNHRHIFNRMVVVTSHEDKATQRLCEFYNVQCMRTDATNSRKGQMCKGAAINEGLACLDRDAWMLHMDADIWLPPLFRPTMECLDLDTKSLYGADRFMVRSHRDWQAFREMPRLQHENGSWLHLAAFEMGTRVVIPGWQGYIPIGFFQLWHADSGIKTYPSGHTDAGREDGLFAIQWPGSKRHNLSEIIVYHLESEHAPMASNWGGRQTLPFTHDGTDRIVRSPMSWAERRRTQQPDDKLDKQTDAPTAASPTTCVPPSYE